MPCAGDSYLVLDCPLSELVRHIASELSTQIHCNSPVSRIDHDHKGALVRLYGGRWAAFLSTIYESIDCRGLLDHVYK